MAQQTKSKTTRGSNGRRASASKPRTSGGSSRSRTRSSSNGSQARGSAGRTTPSKRSAPSSRSPKSTLETAKDTTAKRAKSAGGAVSSAAKKLKTPAIATGVGLAGLAGGVALGRGTKSKKSLGLPRPGRGGVAKATSKKLSRTVKDLDVGAVAEQTGQIAERVRQVSAAVAGEHQGTPRRSPLEVVLEGLTRRSAGAAPRD
jgi:hypothetical protein